MRGQRIVLLSCALFSVGCCPKITSQTEIIRDTTVVYQPDTIIIPEIRQDYDVDLRAICDSLYPKLQDKKGHSSNISIKTNKGQIIFQKDSTGKTLVSALIFDYEHRLDSLKQIITINQQKTTKNVVYSCNSKFHVILVWLFWLGLLIVILLRLLKS